jgi:hypothetical protein
MSVDASRMSPAAALPEDVKLRLGDRLDKALKKPHTAVPSKTLAARARATCRARPSRCEAAAFRRASSRMASMPG